MEAGRIGGCIPRLTTRGQRLVGLVVSLLAAIPGTSVCQRTSVSLQRILTDSVLWGKDFPIVLANLPSWGEVGENNVSVFRDRVLGGTAYPDSARAQPAVTRVRDALNRPKGTPQPEFAALLDVALKTPAPFQTAVTLFGEDHSARIAWAAPTLQLLADSLTVARVQQRLGAPETVVQRLIQTERDHRPAVLTLRSYAGGAVVFIETDWAPRPGFVDRVVLDTRTVSAALFRRGGQ